MAKIIIEDLEKSTYPQRFKLLLSFYFARAKRILPTLIVVCSTLIILGWFFLGPIEYKTLAKHTTSALLFFSNIQLQQEAGYFDISSQEKWLLHTWSLAVEWQFYLVIPLLILFSWTKNSKGKAPTIILGSTLLLSLLAAIYYTTTDPNKAFYIFPTRAWEILSGSLTFFITRKIKPKEKHKKLIEYSGFSLVIFSFFAFNKYSEWPGINAIIPILGASLIIFSERFDSPLTKNIFTQWLGTRSYSLYLWHWPIVATLYFLGSTTPKELLTGIILTIIIGALSYRYIEEASRKFFKKKSPTKIITLILTSLFTVIICDKLIASRKGYPDRLPEKYVQILNEVDNINPRRSECHVSGMMKTPGCTFGGEQIGALVIGDSHAASIITAVENSLPEKKLNVLQWTFSACPTFKGVKQENTACSSFIDWALEKQKELAPQVPVIIMNETSAYIHGFSHGQPPTVYFNKKYTERTPEYLKELRNALIDAACEISKYHPVFMVRPIPEMKVPVPAASARAFLLGKNNGPSISIEEYQERNRLAWEAQDAAHEKCGVTILDPLPYLCRDDKCYGTKDGWPIYYDDNHLSERAAKIISPLFERVFQRPLQTQKSEKLTTQ